MVSQADKEPRLLIAPDTVYLLFHQILLNRDVGIPMSDSSAGRGLNTSYEQAVPLPDYTNQVSDQAYDLPPPPDELRFNMDSISQSNSSITNVSKLLLSPGKILTLF